MYAKVSQSFQSHLIRFDYSIWFSDLGFFSLQYESLFSLFYYWKIYYILLDDVLSEYKPEINVPDAVGLYYKGW